MTYNFQNNNNHHDNFRGADHQIIGILLFITDLLCELNKLISDIEDENYNDYLNLIEKHLGPNQRAAINSHLNRGDYISEHDHDPSPSDDEFA